MPWWDGDAGRRALAASLEVSANRTVDIARAGQSRCPRVATLEKKRLQGCADIGILYSPTSGLEVVTTHPRCFSALYGRKVNGESKEKQPQKSEEERPQAERRVH